MQGKLGRSLEVLALTVEKRVEVRTIKEEATPKSLMFRYKALLEKVWDALPFVEFVELETKRVGIDTRSKTQTTGKGAALHKDTTREGFDTTHEERFEGKGAMEDEDSTLTPIVVPESQQYEVINDHRLVNIDDILACDESRVEKKYDEQEGEEKEEVGNHFPNRHNNSQLAGMFITSANKESMGKEWTEGIQYLFGNVLEKGTLQFDLSKSHRDIPSTFEQGMEVVQQGKTPIIEGAKAKGDESVVERPRNKHISDLLLPSLPSHGANHHNQFDTNMGKMWSTLSSKGSVRLEETLYEGQDSGKALDVVGGLLLIAVKRRSFDGNCNPNKKQEVTQVKHRQMWKEKIPSGEETMPRKIADLNSEILSHRQPTFHMWLTHGSMKMEELERMEWMGNVLTIICGTHHPSQVKGLLHDQRVTILVENGNTHQFIEEEFARRMGPNKARYKGYIVTITYGTSLLFTRKILQLTIPMETEAHIVLGAQELQTLGEFTLKIHKRGLKLQQNEEVRIHEIRNGKCRHVEQGRTDFIYLPAVGKGLIIADNSRKNVANNIMRRYGKYLFDNESYEESMQQFLASTLDINAILCLYPSLTFPKSSNDSSSEHIFESSSGTLSEHLTKTFFNALDEAEGASLSLDEEKSKCSNGKLNRNSLTALIKFLLKRRKTIIGKAAAEDTDEVVAAVVENASSSVDSWRSSSSIKHTSISKGSRDAREKATILDTVLVQCLLLTGQSSGALELLGGPNYCDVKICEEFMVQRGHYLELIELYNYNEMHREALKLLNQLVADSSSLPVPLADTQKIGPEAIIEYLKPLGGLDPALVLDCSTWILGACPQQTMELFSSTDPPLPPNLVSSYLKQQAPHMQVTYLEHMLATHGNALSSSLQNELLQIYLAKVLDEYADLKAQEKWNERQNSTVRQKLLAALGKTSGYNAEVLLKCLPSDALYEERAFLLGKMERHQLALTLYAHKLREPELALGYCDLIYNTATSVMSAKNTSSQVTSQVHNPGQKTTLNIYLTLLQVYLNPQTSKNEFDQTIAVFNSSKEPATYKIGPAHKAKGHMSKNVVEIIERIEDPRQSLSGTRNDSAPESERSDGEESFETVTSIEGNMLDEAINLLCRRWDRINGAEALRLLPSDIKLQLLLPFLEPLLKKSSEARRNLSVIKSLRHSENLQVKDELYKNRKRVVQISGESNCSLCNKRIASSVFAVYPNGTTVVHFVCFRDSQTVKAVTAAPTMRVS
ncbi:hypothetical protein KI387_028422 [Taxus chinensis]|uniref:Vam6/Vps39-like protein n=1 Tax=Taxus chinensis TaxID=29808 RepID=A0AA38LAG2_TAXCH|nr:hypothetical protein KI387_028422 [Taxus chinensis]